MRGAVFDAEGRLLLVRETADSHRWSLPGGWAEVNQTPAQSVMREIFEESGYHARPLKLAAVWDRARQALPPAPYSVVRLFFVCALEGGEARDQPGNQRPRLVSRSGHAGRSVARPNVAAAHRPDVRALAGAGTADRVRLNGRFFRAPCDRSGSEACARGSVSNASYRAYGDNFVI